MKYSEKFSDEIVLASASPRRRELLHNAGYEFSVCVPDVDESIVHTDDPRALVKALSRLKAQAAAETAGNAEKTVIGADTVVYRRKIYGKPKDARDAVRMISELNGRIHRVYTGVTVACGGRYITFCVMSGVRFKRLSRDEIKRYVDECRPLDKAGSYGIQDKRIVGGHFGSYTNIVGLPMEKLTRILTKVGIKNGNHGTVVRSGK